MPFDFIFKGGKIFKTNYMKMFSDCSGKCEDCRIFYTGGCLAGHGDDDFVQITKERAEELIKEKRIKEGLIKLLKNKFDIL